MQELADSIEERGVIVPILVRPLENGMYVIVAGHNRVEASTSPGKMIFPAILGKWTMTPRQSLWWTQIYNLP